MARVTLTLTDTEQGVTVELDYGGDFDAASVAHQLAAFVSLNVLPELTGETTEDERVDAEGSPRADVAPVDEQDDKRIR